MQHHAVHCPVAKIASIANLWNVLLKIEVEARQHDESALPEQLAEMAIIAKMAQVYKHFVLVLLGLEPGGQELKEHAPGIHSSKAKAVARACLQLTNMLEDPQVHLNATPSSPVPIARAL